MSYIPCSECATRRGNNSYEPFVRSNADVGNKLDITKVFCLVRTSVLKNLGLGNVLHLALVISV